jgi:hypothetical protein
MMLCLRLGGLTEVLITNAVNDVRAMPARPRRILFCSSEASIQLKFDHYLIVNHIRRIGFLSMLRMFLYSWMVFS